MSGRIDNARIRISGFLHSMGLRLACMTWQKQYNGLKELDYRLANGERLILIFWHGKYVALLPLFRNRDACVFTSLSSRGDVIADILTRFGFTSHQIPDHGGDHSLAIMRNALSQGQSAAIAVDGPLGPQHIVHRGAIQLASSLGHSLVPASVAISRKRVITARWDKLELPRLFSRVQLVIGQPFCIPENVEGRALTFWINKTGLLLEAVNKEAEVLLRT